MTDTAARERPWPQVPCPGGWQLGPPMTGDLPVRYLNMAEFHAIVGGNKRALYTLRKRDGGIWFPDPAILIGEVAGWEKADVIRWGMDTGRLNPDGTINTSRVAAPFPDRPPAIWRRVTRVYLSVGELAEAWGMRSGMGVTMLRHREPLLKSDVVAGAREGFSVEWGERFARQTGRPWNLPPHIAAALERPPEERHGGTHPRVLAGGGHLELDDHRDRPRG